MAKVFLSANESFTLSNNAQVYGADGGTEVVKISSNAAAIELDSECERVEVASNLADYTYQVAGNLLYVYYGTGAGMVKVASIIVPETVVGGTPFKIWFADGSAEVAITGANAVTLGGVAVPTVQGTVTGATIDTTEKSTVAGGGGTGTTYTLTTLAQTLTLTTGNDTVDGSLLDSIVTGNKTLIDPSTTDSDTMNLLVSNNVNPTNVANIENVNITGKYGTVTLDGSKFSGVTTFGFDSSIGAGAVTVNTAPAATYAASTNVTGVTLTSNTVGGTFTLTGTEVTNFTITDAAGAAAETFGVTMSKVGNLNFNGGAGNGTNTFTGTLISGANNVTLTGGTGTDTFSLNLNGGTSALTGSQAIETLNLQSSGAANTLNMTNNAVLVTTGKIVATGDQSLTMTGLAASSLTGVTFTDSTTAGTTTVRVTNAGAVAADLSKIGADILEFTAATNNTTTVTLGNGQTVKWSDGTASVKTAATTTTDVVNVTANAAGVLFEDGGTNFANIKFTSDRTTTTTLTAVMDDTAGTGTKLTILGSGDSTVAATSRATAVDGSGMTGKLNVTYDNTNDIVNVTGGSGNDTFNFSATQTNATVTIDGGAGTDTMKFTAATNFNNMSASVVTGIDTFDVNGQNVTLTQKQLFTTGATFGITSTAGGGSLNIVDDGASSKVFNLGSVTFAGGVAAPAINITGSAGVDNITGSTVADSIAGAAGNDVISSGTGNDSVLAGAGADTVNVGSGTDRLQQHTIGDTGTFTAPGNATTTISTTAFDVITGMGTGDLVYLTTTAGGTSDYSGAVSATAANNKLVTAAQTANDLTTAAVAADNTVGFVRGTYDSSANTFIGAASGSDTLMIYDSNATAGASAYEAIVLVGFTASGTPDTGFVTLT